MTLAGLSGHAPREGPSAFDRYILKPATLDDIIAALNLSEARTLVRVPMGVVGVIGPWNYPLTNSFGDCIPALMAGNSVILIEHNLDVMAEADWIVGEGLFTSNVNGVGIRSMKAPPPGPVAPVRHGGERGLVRGTGLAAFGTGSW